MVTFSPDRNLIITANEGEPNANYTVDPVGFVSVIDIKNNSSVKTLDFTSFESSLTALKVGGFRVYGPNATLAKDVEPEYVTISADSKRAWVTLQENNAVAEIDLITGPILRVLPLGVKDISIASNAFDVSDKDDKMAGTWPIKAFYLPDAISMFRVNNNFYLALANQGDTRDYGLALTLDPTRFPNAATLKLNTNIGRLTDTRSNGDTDGDGDYDELDSTGGQVLPS